MIRVYLVCCLVFGGASGFNLAMMTKDLGDDSSVEPPPPGAEPTPLDAAKAEPWTPYIDLDDMDTSIHETERVTAFAPHIDLDDMDDIQDRKLGTGPKKLPAGFSLDQLDIDEVDEEREWGSKQSDDISMCRTCGSTGNCSDQARIVNGYPMNPACGFPWACFMFTTYPDGSMGQCGAFILSRSQIGTAAHCMAPDATGTPTRVDVYCGCQHNTATGRRQCVRRTVTSANFRIHPNYNDRNMQNDYGRLDLPAGQELTCLINRLNPVCLPPGPGYTGCIDRPMAVVSGWGTTSAGGQVSTVNRFVPLQRKSDSTCVTEARNNRMPFNQTVMVCTINTRDQSDCQGDSGGALVCLDKNKYTVLGIVSFGPEDCRYISIYARPDAVISGTTPFFTGIRNA